MYSFFKVWASVLVFQSYCYMVGKFVPIGLWRLVSRLPFMCLFFLFPLCLESVNLSGPTGFFISWLGNFKLLLFAFGKGPLATEKTLCSLPHFIAIACLPIKVQQKLARDGHKDKLPGEETGRTTFRNYIVKAALLAAMIRVYDFHGRIHPTVIYFLYCFHMYFAMEIILAVPAAAVRAAFGMELEPQFNDPRLSTSLQVYIYTLCFLFTAASSAKLLNCRPYRTNLYS